MICFLTTLRGNDGTERGDGESRSSPALRDANLLCATGQKTTYLGLGVVDGEHQRCASLRSLPDTCLLCASPYRLPTILLLAFPFAVSLWQNQKHRRARITLRDIPGGERLSAHSR